MRVGFLTICLFWGMRSFLHPDHPKYELVVCALFQDEELFLEEWIAFHRLIGVEHFYLYNNLSQDRSVEILAPYVREGIVDLFDWPVTAHSEAEYLENIQLPIYNQLLSRVKKEAKWAAFIDPDEFIVPRRGETLAALLRDYDAYAALAVNWQIYGTSGWETIPEGSLLTETLIWKGEEESSWNQIVKLIVQPEYVQQIHHPHFFEYRDGCYAVDTEKRPQISSMGAQVLEISRLQINHYWFGTGSWFKKNKLPRRSKWGIRLSTEQIEEIMGLYNRVKDLSILPFIPALRRQLEQKAL